MEKKEFRDIADLNSENSSSVDEKEVLWQEITPAIQFIHYKTKSAKAQIVKVNAPPETYIFDIILGGEYEVLYGQKKYTRFSETAVIHSRTPGIAKFKLKENRLYEFYIIAFDIKDLNELMPKEVVLDYLAFQNLKDAVTFRITQPTLEAIHHLTEFLNKQKKPAPLQLLSHIYIIVNMLIEQFLEKRNKESMHSLQKWEFDELQKITEQIKNHPEKEYSITEISEKIAIQVPEIQKGFKEMYNQTFARFIKEIRLEKAGQLLSETDLTISEVIYRVGINSRSHFSRIFKKKFGVSPSSYRSNSAQAANKVES